MGILLAITAALMIYAVVAPHPDDPSAYDASVSLNLYWGYFLLVFAIASAIFCAVFGTIKNPASLKLVALSAGLIIVIVGVAYFLAAGHTVNIPDLANNGYFGHTETVITETSVIVTYVAMVAAFLVAVATEVYNAFK